MKIAKAIQFAKDKDTIIEKIGKKVDIELGKKAMVLARKYKATPQTVYADLSHRLSLYLHGG